MKKLAVVFFTLWSAPAFASVDLLSAVRAGGMNKLWHDLMHQMVD